MADEVWSGPWFPFYVDAWMLSEDVAAMSDAAVACYLRLLCWEWKKGSIPADPQRIAAILSRPAGVFVADIWPQLAPCFEPHSSEGGRLVNPRLEAERQEAEQVSSKRSRAGAAGAAAANQQRSADPRGTAAANARQTRGTAAAPPQQSRGPAGVHAHAHEDLAAGASLSSSSLAGAGAGAGPEREISHPKGSSPDGNAASQTSNPETRQPPNAGFTAVAGVKAAWEERYRAVTQQSPDWGVRTNACASRLTAIPLAELRARMDRFFAGAPVGFWRSIRQGEFPDILGFEHCVGRLVEVPLPVVYAPQPVCAAPAPNTGPVGTGGSPTHPRLEGAAAVLADAERKIAAIRARRAAEAEPATVEVRVVETKAGAPPPVLALADGGGP